MPSPNDLPFSRYGSQVLKPAPVSRFMAAFARDFRPSVDINVGVGYVNEDTLPYEALAEATAKVTREREVFRSSLNYGDPAGTVQLRSAVMAMLLDDALPEDRETLAGKSVLIGTNGATSILEGLAQIMEPGIVIMADPVYYIYSHFLTRFGYEILALPEDAQGMIPEKLEHALNDPAFDAKRLRFVYVVSVSNPTGSVLTNARRHRIVEILQGFGDKRGLSVPVIFDQAYVGLIHDEAVELQESAFRNDRRQSVYEVGTLSKILAPALRLGYIVGADGPLMRALQERNSDVGFSASPINQQVASVLLNDYLPNQKKRVLAGYRERALKLTDAFAAKLAPYLEEVRGGQAGFYFYLTFKDIETHDKSDFYNFLSRTTGDAAVDGESPESAPPKLAYIPGEYCVLPGGKLGSHGARSLRFSYGFEPTQRLLQAVDLIAEAAEYAISRSRS